MKSIHSSLYRVRSNSLTSVHRPLHTTSVIPLTFFDSPPPPLRPGVLTSPNRLPTEHPTSNSSTQHSSHSHGGHPPLPLALGTTPSNSSSQIQSQYALFTYSSSPPKSSSHPQPAHSTHETPHRAPKRQRLKYQLDVGAYGIPKRCRTGETPRGLHTTRLSPQPSPLDDLSLAVQVGEDAYFVRDNAMGVADGVGGWTRSKHHDPAQPSASALFARRLMHYCSAEIESSATAKPLNSSSSRPQFSFSTHLKPRPGERQNPLFSNAFYVWEEIEAQRQRQQELEEDLLDSLDELSEGIDVLQILERAYDQTIKTHVSSNCSSPSPSHDASSGNPSTPSQSSTSFSQRSKKSQEPTPLMTGSSTALLAVLDHAPQPPANGNSSMTTLSIVTSSAHPPLSSSAPSTSSPFSNYAAGTLHPSIYLENDAAQSCDAVIRIAHIGDCMGMLVRDEEIIWRSEEMWWDFNMPLQLGPATHPTVTPSTTAHHFTLPVKADDILILASDGLSDNLWDEEVLDEVIKFRRSFLGKDSVPQPANAQSSSSTSTAESGSADRLLRRKTLAGMLSEALCSRARKVSERRGTPKSSRSSTPPGAPFIDEDEVPFARRAREAGRTFRGGKHDDISVIVAVISPAHDDAAPQKVQA
ncbi:hypothetical protein CC1G_00123 [Coprinopsis cinerea okayama7|uniref:Protein phosphatase n=1 Tax=Coprinopsis cinerea (strain Okayama-7 / 130 / ATCC MYA-4618 / FGSC 9003) TaxID=240176 RepID=A8NWU4_COPC7|nr:hypothetical protein CC1G_00123 [Coprinopsis cinerea okayama7\|eukprot:XP_001836987.2 hypothetical protein CC1G_00123 [Coprinopsis cinerea okayama7\